MKPVVRVATINKFNDLSRWQERRSLLAEGLAALSLDLIGLQEVTHRVARLPTTLLFLLCTVRGSLRVSLLRSS